MTTAIVEFKLPQPITVAQAKETFLSTAPKYGTDPNLAFLECPVVVDNVSHEIISDGQ